MKREFKPGDVAMSRYGRVFYSGNESRGSWTFDDGSGGFDEDFRSLRPNEPTDVRPLVVIDPEDREQVETVRDRLFDAIEDQNPGRYDFPCGVFGNALQAALREFANSTPPKCRSSVEFRYGDGVPTTSACTLDDGHDGMHSAGPFMWGGAA